MADCPVASRAFRQCPLSVAMSAVAHKQTSERPPNDFFPPGGLRALYQTYFAASTMSAATITAKPIICSHKLPLMPPLLTCVSMSPSVGVRPPSRPAPERRSNLAFVPLTWLRCFRGCDSALPAIVSLQLRKRPDSWVNRAKRIGLPQVGQLRPGLMRSRSILNFTAAPALGFEIDQIA
jgi:hypothetical protein